MPYFIKIRQVGAELFHVKLDRGAHLKVDGPHIADRCRRKISRSAKLCCLMVATTNFK
jgi:RNase P/RNase MRP subunit p29